MSTCGLQAFTEIDGETSGQRLLGSSDPRLIRQVEISETAGGGFQPSPAGKDEKLPREFEGGALIGREAPVPSLLDSVTNNRHTLREWYTRPAGRGRHCGRFTIVGVNPKGHHVYRRVNCGAWTCSYCGPRKARLAKLRIRDEASKLGLHYFWTLTLAPRNFQSPKERVRHIRRVFNKFREYLRRRYGFPPSFICVLEFTQRGIPHLHVLFDTRIPHEWVSSTWDTLGGGRVVWVEKVTINNVARYLSKYLTKDLLLSAPKGTRRITTSRSIKLFPKFRGEIAWLFHRESIWNMLAAHRAATCGHQEDLFRFTILHPDEEGYLNRFEVIADG